MEEVFSNNEAEYKPRSVDLILAEGFTVNPIRIIRRAFQFFGNEAGIYVAFTLVYVAISMALSALPVVGDVSGMLVGPPLVAGFACYMRLQSRNEYREFSNFFGGFRGGRWPSLVSQGISLTLSMVIVVAAVVLPFFLDVIQVFVTEFEKVQSMDQEKAAEFMLTLFTPQLGLAALLAALVAVLVMTFFCLAPLFIVYRGYNAFQAIGASWKLVVRKYPSFLMLNVLLWLIIAVGFLLCCVGLLAALPIYYLAFAAAYEEITGD
jgi:hypothetical protein